MAASLKFLCLSVLLLGARCVLALEGHSQPRFAETALMLHGDGADARRAAVKNAAAALTPAQLSGSFASTQKMLVGACGMRWLPTADVGKGRNSHCFADFNHVACCVMPDGSQDKENQVTIFDDVTTRTCSPHLRFSPPRPCRPHPPRPMPSAAGPSAGNCYRQPAW